MTAPNGTVANSTANGPRLTGKHPPGSNHPSRPPAGSKTRPQAHSQFPGNGAQNGNAAKIAERRRAALKQQEFAKAKAKQNGVSAGSVGGNAVVRRPADTKVCLCSACVVFLIVMALARACC